MRDWLQPIIIFAVGNIALLFLMLFFPALGTVQTQLEADTAGFVSNFWGLSWVVTSVKLIVFCIFEGTILFLVGKAFLGLKSR